MMTTTKYMYTYMYHYYHGEGEKGRAMIMMSVQIFQNICWNYMLSAIELVTFN